MVVGVGFVEEALAAERRARLQKRARLAKALAAEQERLRKRTRKRLAKAMMMRDGNAFEAFKSRPRSQGPDPTKQIPVITAPGWNIGGSSFGDLRPRKSVFSGATLRSRRLRRIMKAKGFGGGGPAFEIIDLEDSILAEFLRVTEAEEQRLTEDEIERRIE